MASLINCQDVVKYTAQEFPGDSPFGLNLELQAPLENNPFNQDPSTFYYFLVIESLPGFYINASMINIGGLFGDNTGLNQSQGITWMWSSSYGNDDFLPVDEYGTVECRAMDTNSADPLSCDNKVVVKVEIPFDFVMPASNYTISIDFGGEALSCDPTPDPIEVGDAVVSNLSFQALNTNYYFTNPFFIWAAKYYPTFEEAAMDSLNWNIVGYSAANTQYDGYGNINEPDTSMFSYNVFSPNGWAPQFYTFEPDGAYDTDCSNPLTPSNCSHLGTLCGQLYAQNGNASYSEFGGLNNLSGENYLQPVGGYNNNTTSSLGGFSLSYGVGRNQNWNFRFYQDISISPSSLGYNYGLVPTYVSSVDNPTITPGDGFMPASITWDIRVSAGFSIEAASGVDVWKAITIKGEIANVGSAAFSEATNGYLCADQTADIEILQSEYNAAGTLISNDSYLDITNVSITNPHDDYPNVVRISIPLKSGLQHDLWATNTSISDVNANKTHTKIFYNLYPTEN